MTRRVLILAYDFPPRGGTAVLRVTKFARYLSEFGWQPVVVSAAIHGGLRDDALLAQLPPDIEVIRVPNPFAPSGAGTGTHTATPSLRARIRRQLRNLLVPDAQMLWVPAAVRAASRRLAQGDIAALYSTAPPYSVHVAGRWLKQRFPTLPWLMDLRDIWSENPAITNVVTYKLQRAWEAACVRAADHVSTATDGQRRLLLAAHALDPSRTSTITNGFDSADLPQSPATLRPMHAPLRLTYVGSIIGTRAAASQGLFDALRQLQAEGMTAAELQVRLIGIFDQSIYAAARPLEEEGLVRLEPFVPQAAAYAAMADSDVLLLLASDDREGQLSHPNKLFEYFALGRPILALAPHGDVARLIRDANAGETVAPRDTAGIAAALRRLAAAKGSNELARPEGDTRWFARFERRELTRRLAAQLDALLA